MDNKVVIGTELDTEGVDEGIDIVERRLQELKDQRITLDIDNVEETMEDVYNRVFDGIRYGSEEWEKLSEAILDTMDGSGEWQLVVLQALQGYLNDYKELSSMQIIGEADKQKMEEIRQAIQDIVQMYEEVTGEKLFIKGFTDVDNTLPEINSKLSKMGKSLENIGKKVGRMWLSILGISTLFGTIRSSVSRIINRNEELKGKIESIRNAIDSVVARLVDLVFPIIEKIIQYIGFVFKKLFNIDIFKKSTEGAKKLNKTFAKFDEMSTTQTDNKDKEYGIKPLEEKDAPKWLKWLVKNAKKLSKYLLLIAGAIIGIKTGLGLIKGLGIGLILLGIYDTIKAIIDLINGPSVENVGKVLKGIGELVLGIGIAFGSLPTAITGALILIVGLLITYYDKIIGWFNKIIEYVDSFKDKLREKIGPIADILLYPITFALNFAKNLYEQFYGGIRTAIDGVLKILNGDFAGGIAKIFEGIVKTTFAVPIAIFEAFKSILQPIVDWVKNNVINPLVAVFQAMKTTLSNVFGTLGQVLGQALKTGLVAIINGFIGTLEAKLNAIRSAVNMIIQFLVGPGGQILSILGVVKIPQIPYISLPKLAKGGIINKVGSGVPVGSAIAGERGREAVIPLTDSQQMALLGQEIAKNVVINLTSVVDIDGRQIARSVNQVMNDMQFASNGGVI